MSTVLLKIIYRCEQIVVKLGANDGVRTHGLRGHNPALYPNWATSAINQASQIIAHTISVLKMVKLLYLMTMRELNGSELAGFIKERQAKQVRALRQAWHINPRLAIVTDVENPVIETYMRLKQRYGADILIDVEIHRVPAGGALEVIQELNNRDDIQGIILQLPISNSDQTEELLESIREDKDVDGLRKRAIFHGY